MDSIFFRKSVSSRINCPDTTVVQIVPFCDLWLFVSKVNNHTHYTPQHSTRHAPASLHHASHTRAANVHTHTDSQIEKYQAWRHPNTPLKIHKYRSDGYRFFPVAWKGAAVFWNLTFSQIFTWIRRFVPKWKITLSVSRVSVLQFTGYTQSKV
jgi:hypothetical protein